MLASARYVQTLSAGMITHGLWKLARPKQWVKNVYVFAAVVFAGQLFTGAALTALLGFFYFCLASSTVYVLNDIVDATRDELHPTKRLRPIPAGLVSKRVAWFYLATLVTLWLPGAYALAPEFSAVAAGYFLLNVAYSFKLKHLFLLDVMTIAFGFVLRAVAGALLIHVPVSPWLFVCTILISLFLALGKRRSELAVASSGHREVLSFYSVALVDQFLSGLSGTTIIAYSLYTFFARPGGEMMWTIPFVVYGLFRYLYLVHRTDLAGSPEEALLSDYPLLVNVGLWAASVALILYR